MIISYTFNCSVIALVEILNVCWWRSADAVRRALWLDRRVFVYYFHSDWRIMRGTPAPRGDGTTVIGGIAAAYMTLPVLTLFFETPRFAVRCGGATGPNGWHLLCCETTNKFILHGGAFSQDQHTGCAHACLRAFVDRAVDVMIPRGD